MPYPSGINVGDLIQKVRAHFLRDPEFQSRAASSAIFYDWINEFLDEIYADCGYQPDEFTVNTVLGQSQYPLDGTTGNFPDEVDQILAVNYDGKRLKYRYFYPQQVLLPTAEDTGAPDGWYERWDGGVRYLGLNAYPQEVVELTIIATRQAQSVSSDSAVPALERDYFPLLLNLLIMRVYEWTGQEVRADRWLRNYVLPGKQRLRHGLKKRQGKQAEEVILAASQHYYAT